MGGTRKRGLLRGMAAGAAAGMFASWAMNVFMNGPGSQLQEALKTDEERRQEHEHKQRQQESSQLEEDVTMKIADKVTVAATGGQHLSMEGERKGGPIVHYAFGTLAGAVYGGMAEYSSAVRAGFGTAFGAALFLGADVVAVPALHLSSPPGEYPLKSLANPLVAHLVYGTATELARKVLRAL